MRPRSWAQLLPIAEYAHNSWKHNALKVTPHELIMGMKPHVNTDLIPDTVPAAQERIQTLHQTCMDLQVHLDQIQKVKDNKMPPQLTIGQRVWLEGHNLHVRGPVKLLPKRYGPFQIKQKIRNVAYHLELPASIKVHDVFHIDLLTPYKEMEEYRQAYTRPPPITVQSEEEYEVESILQARCKGPSDSLEYKVHWKGYPSADDSWVPHDNLHSPELLKEFYDQGGKVLQDKRRRTRLRKAISSLSCPPPITSTPSSLKSSITMKQPLTTPSFRSRGAWYIPPTSHAPSISSKILWWLSQRQKKKPNEEQSSGKPSKRSEGILMQEMVRPTSSTPHPDRYKGSCSWTDTSPNRTLSVDNSSSIQTSCPSTPPHPHLGLPHLDRP